MGEDKDRYFIVKPGSFSRCPDGKAKLVYLDRSDYRPIYHLEWPCGHKDIFTGRQLEEVK